jgi:ribosomal protein S18 acetylase RimI-like enzyme
VLKLNYKPVIVYYINLFNENMTLTKDIEEFQRNITKSKERLEGVYGLANRLLKCSVDELDSQFAKLQCLCNDALNEIKYTADILIEINDIWGDSPIQYYSEKQLKTNNTADISLAGENFNYESLKSLDNANESQENFSPDEWIHEAIKVAIKLAAFLISLPTVTSMVLFTNKTAKIFELSNNIISQSIELNNRIVAKAGMPLSKDSLLANIKEMSDRNEEYFGLDSEVAADYGRRKKEEEGARDIQLKRVAGNVNNKIEQPLNRKANYINTKIDEDASDGHLNGINKWIKIHCDEDPWGDYISAERTSDDTVSILNLGVHESRQGQGRAKALISSLFAEIPNEVTKVVIKSNDNPEFWNYAKHTFEGIDKLFLDNIL